MILEGVPLGFTQNADWNVNSLSLTTFFLSVQSLNKVGLQIVHFKRGTWETLGDSASAPIDVTENLGELTFKSCIDV